MAQQTFPPAPGHADRPITALMPARPVRVELPDSAPRTPHPEPHPFAPTASYRVWAVVPCHNRPRDAQLLLNDLALLEMPSTRSALGLRVLLVDNASDTPLATIAAPPGLNLDHLRLPENTGGSGGFNAGLAHALKAMASEPVPESLDLLWLVDSDARVRPDTLKALVEAIDGHDDIVAAGSAVADPHTGHVFEVGGRVNRRNGVFSALCRGVAGLRGPVDCDYSASCSLLVRADAARRAGLMQDVFLNSDDVEWCIRLSRDGMPAGSRGRVIAVPTSIVHHPNFNRFATGARYYVARNALGPLHALGLGPSVRFRRAFHEVNRAVRQEMMGRPDLARLHIHGLADAARGMGTGAAPPGRIRFEPFRPLAELAAALEEHWPRIRGARARLADSHSLVLDEETARILKEQLAQAGLLSGEPGPIRARASHIRRVLLGPRTPVGVVPAKGDVRFWQAARFMIQLNGVIGADAGFVLRRGRWFAYPARAAITGLIGAWYATRVALRTRPLVQSESRSAPCASPDAGQTPTMGSTPALDPVPPAPITLSVIILSHNRWSMLCATLVRLQRLPELAGTQIIVVDNASADDSADRVRLQFPGVKVLPLKDNLGVDAFNRAVRIANSDTVLILDDDACPDQGTISAAVDILTRRPDIAAVALHPRHPLTGKSEWPFAHLPAGKALRDGHWPVMGCGNLIRRDAWLDAGGYEPAFFLYRNDTDLALKLLGPACTAKTRGVYFDPALTVWHDSPGAARKSRRWHRLATRNWIWMARRHGRGLGRGGVCGALLGWTWAHRLAGISPRRHAATFLGALSGVLHRPPSHAVSDGRAFASLVRLQIAGWLNARSGTSPAPARLSVAARKPLSSAPGHSTPPR